MENKEIKELEGKALDEVNGGSRVFGPVHIPDETEDDLGFHMIHDDGTVSKLPN